MGEPARRLRPRATTTSSSDERDRVAAEVVDFAARAAHRARHRREQPVHRCWPRWGCRRRSSATRLLPIGTVYDPFICRGLDALNYACYQDARFILVATPSGLTLAPEGGAHQSVYTPLIGIGQPGLTAFEPAYVDELAEILRWSFEHLQDDDGGSVYLRLSTRPAEQPEREMTRELRSIRLEGATGSWRRTRRRTRDCRLRRGRAGCDRGAPPDRRRHPRGRTAGGDVGRSPPSRLGESQRSTAAVASHVDIGVLRARRQGRSRDRPRRPSGHAVLAWRALAATAAMPLGSRRSGSRATSAISIASTASMPTPCSARQRGSVCRYTEDAKEAEDAEAQRRRGQRAEGRGATQRPTGC